MGAKNIPGPQPSCASRKSRPEPRLPKGPLPLDTGAFSRSPHPGPDPGGLQDYLRNLIKMPCTNMEARSPDAPFDHQNHKSRPTSSLEPSSTPIWDPGGVVLLVIANSLFWTIAAWPRLGEGWCHSPPGLRRWGEAGRGTGGRAGGGRLHGLGGMAGDFWRTPAPDVHQVTSHC